jgi:NADP-dependent 3-hydroxy acid dehydrogenase YdfG
MTTDAVVVTGAGGALGGAIVSELASGERRVLAVGRGLAQVELDARYGSGRVTAVALDVTSRDGWAAVLATAERDGLAVSGAVLAAGGYRGGEPLARSKDDQALQAMLSANLATAHVTLAALLPALPRPFGPGKAPDRPPTRRPKRGSSRWRKLPPRRCTPQACA